MKKFSILFFTFFFTSLVFGQSNSLIQGNNCFTKGDYACAIEKYKNAIKSTDARQKKIAGDNLKQAEKCFELRKIADVAFNSDNFYKAEEHYQSVLNENPKDEYARKKLEEIKIALVTLKVSKYNVSFFSSGGKEYIYVTTEADSFSIGVLPSWYSVQIFEKSLLITCTENTSATERIDYFTISAGRKTERVSIRQSGKQIITLSTSKENLSFNADGGKSEQVLVFTNASKFSILSLPSWCTVQSYNSYFIITSKPNYSTDRKSDWFKVTAGDKEIKVFVTQEGYQTPVVSKSADRAVPNKIKKRNCFNCPKSSDTWGVTAGYSRLEYNSYNLDGVHLGLRIEPLFKYGFGLNTGVELNGYLKEGESLNGNLQFSLYRINVPLHLEYRFNFSKNFNLFTYGGAGFNILTNSTFDYIEIPTTVEYGAGLRIGHVQFNVGKSSYISGFHNIGDIGKSLLPFQSIALSVSYMF